MKIVQHKFVEFIPDVLEEGVLYISVEYCTAIHRCACGCGQEVVTPISPTDWQLTFNGKSVSLSPSIGNWNFECRSHYWIVNNEIRYSNNWDKSQVADGRKKDKKTKKKYFSKNKKSLRTKLLEISKRLRIMLS